MKKHKNDLILFLCLLAIGIIAFSVIKFSATDGNTVSVTVDGQLTAQYPLNRDTEVLLGDSDHGNTLVIKNGYAYLTDATCPDKLCVKQGKINLDGQTIVCLPNKTVITVNSEKSSQTDFVQ